MTSEGQIEYFVVKQAFINAGVMYLSKKIISVDILRGKSATAPLATCLWPPSY